jgi:hypothetical protein
LTSEQQKKVVFGKRALIWGRERALEVKKGTFYPAKNLDLPVRERGM